MAIFGRFATAGARGILRVSTNLLFAALVAGSLGISPTLAQQCVTTGNDVTCTNSGTIPGFTNVTVNGNATSTNSGSVGSNMTTVTVNGNATTTNSGSVATGGVTNITTNGNAAVINQGFIVGGVTDITNNGIATLTNFAGSRIAAQPVGVD